MTKQTKTRRDDWRRAAALITHHVNGDQLGVSAVLEDAHAALRSTELTLAVIETFDQFPEFRRGVHLDVGWLQQMIPRLLERPEAS